MKARERDARDYDTSSLSEKAHGQNLHRDYSAHFFRWSFARRFIKKTDWVLEVGCGPERPLYRIIATNQVQAMKHYVGVDLNPLPAWHVKNADFLGSFNFAEDWKRLNNKLPADRQVGLTMNGGKFDVAVSMEVIEHMLPEHGLAMLKGLFFHLKPGGALLLSTPVYDGVRHAASHIHEYTVPELQRMIERVGFEVEDRYGTFMDLRHLKASSEAMKTYRFRLPVDNRQISAVADALEAYYDRDALSCFFAPLFPDYARNNLWVCRKPT